MKSKEKLLIISAISPFPKTSGGAVRIYNTVKYLSEQFDLYFIFFMPKDSNLNKDEILFLKENTKFFTYFYQKTKKSSFSFINEFQPYWFSDWNDDELKIFLPKIIKKYNIKNVQIDCTQLLYLRNFIPLSANKIFVAYDISTVSFWRRLCEVRNPLYFLIYFFRWLEIFFYEKYFIPLFFIVISMSQNDKSILTNKFNSQNILVKQNGIESINFLKKNATNTINLGYIGSFNHPPNRAAIAYFINEIAPILEQKKIKYKYFIAGDNNPLDIVKIIDNSTFINPKNIINICQVKNLKDFYKKLDILFAPIFSGSGTRIKIMESMSFGIPVITTSVGAEGINIRSKYLSIVNNKKEFIKEIIRLSKKNLDVDKNEHIKLKNSIQKLLWENIFKNYL